MPETTGEKQGRAGGRFQPGRSGNPRGRPKGSRNKVTQLCSDLLSADAEAIMASVIERAKEGDGVALKLAIERLLPARAARDRTVSIDMPAVERAGDLVTAAAEVIGRAAAGQITLSEAREFLALLETERKLIETAELVVRIEALEADVPRQAPGFVDPDVSARVRRLQR